MCSIFSTVRPQDYAFQTRSVRLGGHATSIRLEAMYWTMLEEIAAVQRVTLGRFLSKLHDETLDLNDEPHNFASLLRCACLTYAMEIKGRAGATLELQAVALVDFVRNDAPAHARMSAPNHDSH